MVDFAGYLFGLGTLGHAYLFRREVIVCRRYKGSQGYCGAYEQHFQCKLSPLCCFLTDQTRFDLPCGLGLGQSNKIAQLRSFSLLL